LLDRRPLAALVALAALAHSGPALADGAFPDSELIFTPEAHGAEIILATNFGLVLSEDDGASWRWFCEQAIAVQPTYQVGPGDSRFIFARDRDDRLFVTHDTCRFVEVDPAGAGGAVSDVFPDPIDAMHVVAIARPRSTSTSAHDSLWESRDGGLTYPKTLYAAAPNEALQSVEIARSSTATLYLVLTAPPRTRLILQTMDGGAHWVTYDQAAVLAQNLAASAAPRVPKIAAVDPEDAQRIYFRVLAANDNEGDYLGISDDGGKTLRFAYGLSTAMSAFLRVTGQTLIVGTRGGGYVSTDGGQSFNPWANAPLVRALALRQGKIYAAGDNFNDHFAVGASTDLGQHWMPLFHFDQIAGPYDQCELVMKTCDKLTCNNARPGFPDLQEMFGVGTTTCASTDMGVRPKKSGCSSTSPDPSSILVLLGALVLLYARKKSSSSR
jgi:photosystem II stability/assembly factor-like uncharacterized protein